MTTLRLPNALFTVFALSTGTMLGQVASPDAGLSFQGLIPVPRWTTTGSTAESVDLASFNPVTQILYYADHVAHAVLAIDTRTNSVLGWVPVPNCTASSCPSGVLVVPDLQLLVVTDRGTHVYIYDLKLPNTAPAAVTVPAGIDELDYDPIHQRVYIGNTTSPYFLTGIDLTGMDANTVTASVALPGAPEQARFNPVDGFIYLTVPSVGVLVINPDAGTTGTGGIVNTFPISNCSGNGNWIDPVTNTMMVGCNNVAGEASISLKDGTVLAQFAAVNRDDIIGFNPGLRRWYSGSGSNTNNGGKCPATNAGNVFPVVGVYAAGTVSAPASTLVGVACSGRGGSTIAVDPIHSNIFVPVAQYPLDPASNATGNPGIMVFHDPTAGQAIPVHSQAILGSHGTADFAMQNRAMNATAVLSGLADAPTELVVTTTVGIEEVPCFEIGGAAYCIGTLIGDPLIGGSTLLANGYKLLARGAIAQAQ
jgi:DNA-binding beta-propeller fold protein YncE